MELDMNRRHKHQRRRHSNIVYADTLKKRDHVEDFTQALAEVLSELKKEYDDYAKKVSSK